MSNDVLLVNPQFLEGTVMAELKQFAESVEQYSIAVDGIRQDIMNLDVSTDIAIHLWYKTSDKLYLFPLSRQYALFGGFLYPSIFAAKFSENFSTHLLLLYQ